MKNIDLLMMKVKSKIKILVLSKKKKNLEFGISIDTRVSQEELLSIIKEVDKENKELIISERKKIEENIRNFSEEHRIYTNNQVKKLLIQTEMSMKRILNSFKNKGGK